MAGATLRQQRKWERNRALSLAAQELVAERGLENVTIDDIAAAAGVSVRTFFNHFAGKDDALVGVEPAALDELADELRRRPPEEGPVDALRAVVLSGIDTDGMLRRWELRNTLVRTYPSLLPRYLASMVQIEGALGAALADRLGVDQRTDPRPRTAVAAVLAALRAAIAWWWEESDRSLPLLDVLDRTYTTTMERAMGREIEVHDDR